MYTLFPSLLVYSYYAPAVLRLGVAVVFAYSAWRAWSGRRNWAHAPLPIIGPRSWMPAVAAVLEFALAAMFFFGWNTQIAAILGIIGAVKYWAYRQWWPRALNAYFPISTGAAFLIAIICLSLLMTGAGAFGQDLPL
jgi:uncharacterized membrane protein YphA (DoxX/SURF4 family)